MEYWPPFVGLPAWIILVWALPPSPIHWRFVRESAPWIHAASGAATLLLALLSLIPLTAHQVVAFWFWYLRAAIPGVFILAVAVPWVYRYTQLNQRAWLALWCPNISEATQHMTDDGEAVTLQIHILNIGSRPATSATLIFDERAKKCVIRDLLPTDVKWRTPPAEPDCILFELERQFFRKVAVHALSLEVRCPTDFVNNPIYWRLAYEDALSPTQWLPLTNYEQLPPDMYKRVHNWGDKD